MSNLFISMVWNGLLDVVYPPRCLVCGARIESGALCDLCVSSFVPLTPPFCARCGVPTPTDKPVCHHCEGGTAPPFDWSQALGQYRGTLRQAIHRLKYDGKTALARPLGILLAHSLDNPPTPLLTVPPVSEPLKSESLKSEPLKIDLVVPIPLHPAKLRQRGFNQAERIAFYMAQTRGWQLDTVGLQRIRRTHTQTTLHIAERTANVQGAFGVHDPARFMGKSVLLVDDVLTTTATVTEAARMVRIAGAVRVCVVALARG